VGPRYSDARVISVAGAVAPIVDCERG